MESKKCEKCLGRGFWHVFSNNTVNGTNELKEQKCDKCKGGDK